MADTFFFENFPASLVFAGCFVLVQTPGPSDCLAALSLRFAPRVTYRTCLVRVECL
jgi:hypothetical protein